MSQDGEGKYCSRNPNFQGPVEATGRPNEESQIDKLAAVTAFCAMIPTAKWCWKQIRPTANADESGVIGFIVIPFVVGFAVYEAVEQTRVLYKKFVNNR